MKKTSASNGFRRLLAIFRLQPARRIELAHALFGHADWSYEQAHHTLFELPWAGESAEQIKMARERFAAQALQAEASRCLADTKYIPKMTLAQMGQLYNYLCSELTYWSMSLYFFGPEHDRSIAYRIMRSLPLGRQLVQLHTVIGPNSLLPQDVILLLLDFCDQLPKDRKPDFESYRHELRAALKKTDHEYLAIRQLVQRAEGILLGHPIEKQAAPATVN